LCNARFPARCCHWKHSPQKWSPHASHLRPREGARVSGMDAMRNVKRCLGGQVEATRRAVVDARSSGLALKSSRFTNCTEGEVTGGVWVTWRAAQARIASRIIHSLEAGRDVFTLFTPDGVAPAGSTGRPCAALCATCRCAVLQRHFAVVHDHRFFSAARLPAAGCLLREAKLPRETCAGMERALSEAETDSTPARFGGAQHAPCEPAWRLGERPALTFPCQGQSSRPTPILGAKTSTFDSC